MPIKVDIPDTFLDVDKQLLDVKSQIVFSDVPSYLKDEQSKGFPKRA